MNTVLAPFFLFFFLASTAFAQNGTITINTPTNVVECQPSKLTWTGGTPPYFLSILPGGQPNGVALANLGTQTGTSFTWVANLTVGTSCFLQLRDSTGTLGQSAPFSIMTGTDTSCINSTALTAAPATAASTGASAATGVTSGTAAGTSAAGATGTTKISQSASSTSTGATTKSSKAAAASQYAPVGTLAIIGAAALALVL